MRPPPLLRFLVVVAALGARAEAQPGTALEVLAAAQSALDDGDPDGALQRVAPLLKREPKNARALLLRSTANCMVGEIEACRKDLDRALDLDPKLRQGWLNRSALAIAEDELDDALAALESARKLDPTAPDNAINLGAVRLLRGELEAASAEFRAHLERNPGDADAWYLVASNFAHAGYAALAIEHLQRAIQLDERSRVRARTDANFADLESNRQFQRLLDTDSWVAAPGSATRERLFATRFVNGNSPIVMAVLNVLQLSDTPMDSRVEVTADWALIWAQYRIKISRNADNTTTVHLTAAPGTYFPPTWNSSTETFFQDVEAQLLRLELAAARERPEGR